MYKSKPCNRLIFNTTYGLKHEKKDEGGCARRCGWETLPKAGFSSLVFDYALGYLLFVSEKIKKKRFEIVALSSRSTLYMVKGAGRYIDR